MKKKIIGIGLLLLLAVTSVFAAGDPTATGFNLSAIQGVAKVIQLQGFQVNGHSLAYAIASGPSHGAISQLNIGTGVLVYTATSNYTGSDSFTYTVASTDSADSPSTSSAATVTITVVSNQKTAVNGTLYNIDGSAMAGSVSWILSTQATTHDGIQIPAGGTVSATLSSGSYTVNLYPTDTMSPPAYYQLWFQDAAGTRRQLIGVYNIPTTSATMNQAAISAAVVTDTNLAKRYTFMSETAGEAILAAVSSSSSSHNLLSATHPDTVATGPTAGDLIYSNATPKWDRLPKGTDGKYLEMVSGLPAWVTFSSITAAPNSTGLSISGYSLTGSDTHSLLDLSGTWNTSGNVSGLKLNITNTASGSTSLVEDLELSGQYISRLSKNANLTLGNSSSKTGSISLYELNSGSKITLVPAGGLSDISFTLPGTDGSVGQPLVTDGSGGLSFSRLGVAGGGTGAATLTGILKGNGTSAFTAVTAPTGAIVGTTDSQTLTNKTLTQPIIGDFTTATHDHHNGPNGGQLAGTTALTDYATGFVNSLTGTSNQVTVSASAGAVTLSTPQSIGTGSSPQFAALGLGVTAAGSGIKQLEAAAPSFAASSDVLYADSTAHRWKMSNNNGTADTVVGAATTDTFTNKSLSETQVTFTDVTTGNASTSNHGFLKKLSGSASDCLLGDGTFGSCATAASGANTALSNLASVSINTSLLAQTGVDLGSTAKPFRDAYLFGAGTFGTTYLKLTGTPTSTRTWTFPDSTDTVVGKATTDTFTNKTLDTAGSGNVFKINGTSITAISGNTATVASMGAGTPATNDCAKFDANHNLVSAGAACGSGGGSGTVNSGTQYQLGYYATSTTAVSGNSGLTTDASNDLLIAPTARTSGVAPYFQITIPSDTTLAASTAAPGFNIVSATRQWATGALTEHFEDKFNGPTIGFVGASTCTRCGTFYVSSPIVGTNATFTKGIGGEFLASAAAHVPLYVKGASSQSGNLTEWVNSSDTVLASVSSAGSFSGVAGAFSSTLTAASLNGNTFTTGSYTLTGTAGKTLNFLKTLTLDGTDSTTMTFPAASDTVGGLGTAQTWTAANAYNATRTIASGTSVTLDDLSFTAATTTVTGTTHVTTAKGFNKVSIYKPTITDASAVTIDNAASLYIEAAPLAAGSVTLTNPYALWVAAGAVNFGGTLSVTGHTTLEGVTSTGATGTGKLVYDTAPTLGVVNATSYQSNSGSDLIKVNAAASGGPEINYFKSGVSDWHVQTNSSTGAMDWKQSSTVEMSLSTVGALTINSLTLPALNITDASTPIIRITKNGAHEFDFNGATSSHLKIIDDASTALWDITRVTGDTVMIGKLSGQRSLITAKTANYTVLAADSSTFFDNTGASGEVDFTLPTAAAGLTFIFYVDAAQTVKIIAGASTTIRIAGTASASAGNITNATIGGCVRLTAISTTQWIAEYVQGTWTIN